MSAWGASLESGNDISSPASSQGENAWLPETVRFTVINQPEQIMIIGTFREPSSLVQFKVYEFKGKTYRLDTNERVDRYNLVFISR